MFRAGDKFASVLKPLQLLEMRVGETEIEYAEKNHSEVFEAAKSLIKECLREDPRKRISAKDALNHDLITNFASLRPTVKDLSILPSNVLLLSDALKGAEDEQKVLDEIRAEVEKFGAVSSVSKCGSHIYVEFTEASMRAADAAKVSLGIRKEASSIYYFPVCMWPRNKITETIY